jgi:hypothetical protein
LKAGLESSLSFYSFKRLLQGAFNEGFIASTGHALPCSRVCASPGVWRRELKLKAKLETGSSSYFGFKR